MKKAVKSLVGLSIAATVFFACGCALCVEFNQLLSVVGCFLNAIAIGLLLYMMHRIQGQALKKEQTYLLEQMESMQQADRNKDIFLATLSHELRNQLTPIAYGVQILGTTTSPSHLHETRHRMERQIQQLCRLVDDLLDLGRIRMGKVELVCESVDLVQVAHIAVESSGPNIKAKHHELIVNVPDAPVLIQGDKGRLIQVVLNLLNNAAKYTMDGGQICLTVEKHDNNQATISIQDDGPGIPPAMLDKVFDMFAQVEAGGKGLGIGLTLVKHLVERHGGIVEVQSRLGEGSLFTVRLPLAQVASPPRKPVTLSQGQVPPSRRVLIIDDNRESADTLSLMLQLTGHEVCTAYNGESGIQKVEAFDPEIIFLDLIMPNMSGYETAQRIRNLAGDRKIIALTGSGSDNEYERTKEAGFDSHLLKPVDFATIVEQLMKEAS